MKLSPYLLLLGLLIGPLLPQAQAQAFFDYQAIGKHTWFFSLSWDGQKPHLGMGYNFRLGDARVSDLMAEWRFPLDGMYRLDNHQIIAGWFQQVRAKRLHGGIGVHGKITRSTFDSEARSLYSLMVTYLPSYTYAASINDGLYSSIALRGTYEAILGAKTWTVGSSESATTTTFPAHQIQVGGNLSMHMERTLGISIDGLMQKKFSKNTELFTAEELGWNRIGSMYVGSTYFLKRDR